MVNLSTLLYRKFQFLGSHLQCWVVLLIGLFLHLSCCSLPALKLLSILNLNNLYKIFLNFHSLKFLHNFTEISQNFSQALSQLLLELHIPKIKFNFLLSSKISSNFLVHFLKITTMWFFNFSSIYFLKKERKKIIEKIIIVGEFWVELMENLGNLWKNFQEILGKFTVWRHISGRTNEDFEQNFK